MNQDTICAIATPQGQGAIGIIRLSGDKSIQHLSKIYQPVNKKRVEGQAPYTISFGRIYKKNEVIDEVLVSIFHAPHSFTGEETVEIACHGSSYILQQIMQLLSESGCRFARPGEFTQRAFLNGKMDLSQAEAVADLISSSSEATHRLAMQQMRGGFSLELTKLRDQLLHFTSLIELELDFSEEDVEFANRSELMNLATQIETVIQKLADSFRLGNAIKNGIPVAIVGETNSGKSTLLNALLNEEKAIVSNIPGTTRDVIEDTKNIQGLLFRFIDTAGIRKTIDQIESLGIERTFQKIEQAEIVLWILDATQAMLQIETLGLQIIPLCETKKLIIVINKSDLISANEQQKVITHLTNMGQNTITLSAKNKIHLELLETQLMDIAQIPSSSQSDVIVTNLRHYEALSHALISLKRVKEGMKNGLSGDFISQDIRECLYFLGEITGEISTNDVLGNIFMKFCIGK